MNILHINRTDLEGGAAKAAFRLHQGLREAGHDSRMLVDYKTSPDRSIDAIRPRRNPGERIVQAVERVTGLQYLVPRPRALFRHPWFVGSGLVHLHNLHGGYFSPWLLPAMARVRPLVWTLHDMWPLTGHCSYSYNCERWKTGCGRCPLLSDYPSLEWDTTALLWRVKRGIYGRSRIHMVAPSRWLFRRVRESPLLRHSEIHRIPYGVDTEVFKPAEKGPARDRLGLPREIPLILFGAAYPEERRKGAAELAASLRLVLRRGPSFGLILFGARASESFDFVPKKFSFERIEDEGQLALLYAAADVFAAPSLAENLPNTCLESLACGTPVVAFEAGGMSDAVRHLETGFLAAPGDAAGLADGILKVLGDPSMRKRMSAACRETALREFRLETEVASYAALYRDLMKASGNREAAASVRVPA